MGISGNDVELWKAFLLGDKEAFSTLYYHYSDVLFSYGCRMVGDREVVKDAIQDLFVKLYYNRRSLNETEHVRFYLLKALRNTLLLKLEKRPSLSIDADENLLFQVEHLMSENEDEADELFSETQREELSRAMSTLTARQREAVYLRYISNVPLDEIAQILDMNYQSTRNLIHRSLLKLRKELLPLFLLLFSTFK